MISRGTTMYGDGQRDMLSGADQISSPMEAPKQSQR